MKSNSKPIFQRFNEVSATALDFDFHMHSTYSDGQCSLGEMITGAELKGFRRIAFIDHVREDSTWFLEYTTEIQRFRKNSPIQIYIGLEAKVMDYVGRIDATAEMIGAAELVMGVVHRYPMRDGSWTQVKNVAELGEEKAAETEFELLCALLMNDQVDVVGHPFGVFSNIFKTVPLKYYAEAVKLASERDRVFEINSRYYLDEQMLDLLKKYNPRVSIGSDAHHPNGIGNNYDIIRGYLEK